VVPGAGTGRLAYELVQEGHHVVAVEYSLLMMAATYHLVTMPPESASHTFYPHIHDTLQNRRTHKGHFKPVMFPDHIESQPPTTLLRGSQVRRGKLTLG